MIKQRHAYLSGVYLCAFSVDVRVVVKQGTQINVR